MGNILVQGLSLRHLSLTNMYKEVVANCEKDTVVSAVHVKISKVLTSFQVKIRETPCHGRNM